MAPAIADGKGQIAFADCRRQKQTGKIGNEIPIKSSKINEFYDLKIKKKLSTKQFILQMTQNLHKTAFSNETKVFIMK